MPEAGQILRSYPEIVSLQSFQDERAGYDTLFWQTWRCGPGGGSVRSRRDSSVVCDIGLAFPHDFTLGEVIRIFGEPSHVLAFAARNMETLDETDYTLVLYFQENGIELEYDPGYPPRRPALGPDLRLHSLGLFEPGEDALRQLVTARNPDDLAYLVSWRGYVDFCEYCHAIDSGGGLDPDACGCQLGR